MSSRRSPDDREARIQRAIVSWARMQPRRELRYLLAVPNGGARSPRTAGRLKAEGVLKGAWDLLLPWPRWGYAGAWIEVKAPGGKLTAPQIDFGRFVAAAGFATFVPPHGRAMREAAIAAWVTDTLELWRDGDLSGRAAETLGTLRERQWQP